MRPHRWLVVCTLAVAAGCASTWDVDRFEAPEANIAGRRSFAWTGGELGSTAAVDPSVAEGVDQHIRTAVVTGLVRKGYVEVQDPKTADMLVSYQLAGTRKYISAQEAALRRAVARRGPDKSCFNFKKVEPELFKELKELTRLSIERARQAKTQGEI